jgi:hypothetical protein
MRIYVVLIVAGILAGGCATQEQLRAEKSATCEAIGFKAATNETRDCVLQLAVARRSHYPHRW